MKMFDFNVIHYIYLFLYIISMYSVKGQTESCPPGQFWDPVFVSCTSCEEEGNTDDPNCQIDVNGEDDGDGTKCPSGQFFDPVFGSCSSCEDDPNNPECGGLNERGGAEDPNCPQGQKWDVVFGNCEACEAGDTDPTCPATNPDCPPGQIYDEVFGDCQEEPGEVCPNGKAYDAVFGCIDPPECFNSITEIEDAIFQGDTRQAFNDCDPDKSCSFYRRQGYACAPSWTCHNNTIITDGKGLIDVRSADTGDCSETSGTLDVSDTKCDKVQDVCCFRPNFRAQSCQERSPTGKDKEDYQKCGRSKSKLTLTGLKIDEQDTAAQPGDFPHMCVVYRVIDGSRAYIGGASLIAPNKVITIAHKFLLTRKGETTDHTDKINEFFVRCGEHNVKTEDELLRSQESQVVRIHIHPDYNEKKVQNNLAILETRENFVYAEHIGPVCLPRPNENFDGETECFSSGWGADDYNSAGVFSDALKKVKMPVVDSNSCQRRLREHDRFKNNPGFTIHSSWICIGGEAGSDTCKGDGGSPHVCKNRNGAFVQVGAVAWGIGCGGDVPSVYSSIPAAMCWIDWVMSCVPLSVNNIDSTIADDLDIRGTVIPSKMEMTEQECGEWKRNNPELFERCEVDYEVIDQRFAGK